LLVAKKELEYYYNDPHQSEDKKIKKKPRGNKNHKVLYKMFFIGIAFVGLMLSLFILYRYANISKMRLEITQIQQQKAQLLKEKEDLIAELEALKSSTRIEEDAVVKLGMDYPTEGQIVYISVNEPTLSDEKTSELAEENSLLSQLKSIVNLVSGLF